MNIDYLPNEQKLKVQKFMPKKFFFGKSKPELFDPKEISKAIKGVANPFVGYRNTTTGDRYATEGMCTWHDRHFFDSLIERAKENSRF